MALSAPAQSWVARYNGPANDEDRAWAVACDDADGVYVTGSSFGPGTSDDIFTIKYGANGESLWAVRYDGAASGNDQARAIIVDGERVIVTGGSTESGLATDFLTIAYDRSGTEQWRDAYNDPFYGNDHGLGAAADDAGNVYVTGYAAGDTTGWDFATIKYDPSGVRQWVGSYSTIDEDYAVGVAASPGGEVYAAGSSGSPYTLTWDYVTIRYDAATGDTVWTRRYNGPANEHDEVRAIALDPAGNVIVTGGSAGDGTGADYMTIKYNPFGEVRWFQRFDGSAGGADWANAVAVDDAGNVYVTGSSQDSINEVDYVTIKYDPDGNPIWTARYDGPAHSFDEAWAIAVDAAGDVYVAGSSTGETSRSDYLTVKYNAAGGEEWVRRYDGPAGRFDEPAAIALRPTGGVIVTGGSAGDGTGTDYATLCYSTSGMTEGTSRRTVRGEMLAVLPNPCRGSATVHYALPVGTRAVLTVHDAAGRAVTQRADLKPVVGNGARRIELPAAGVYFARLRTDCGEQCVRKVNCD